MNIDKDCLNFLIKNAVEEKINFCIMKSAKRTTLLFIALFAFILVGIVGVKYSVEHNITHKIGDVIESRSDKINQI